MLQSQIVTFVTLYICNNYLNTKDYGVNTFIQSVIITIISYIATLDIMYMFNMCIYIYDKYYLKKQMEFNFIPTKIELFQDDLFRFELSESKFKNFKEWITTRKYKNDITLNDTIDNLINRRIYKNISDEETSSTYIPIYQYACRKYAYVYYVHGIGINYDLIYCSNKSAFFDIIDMYLKYSINENALSNYIYERSSDAYGKVIKALCGTVSKKKIFDNIFLKNKNELLYNVNKFKRGLLTSKRHLADNKLCLLLYGPSGTGKTSIISAIANELNMSILIFDFSKNKSKNSFIEAVKTCINNKYILVLEEFDCILPIIKSRSDEETLIEKNFCKGGSWALQRWFPIFIFFDLRSSFTLHCIKCY